jgi:hypothetical protein
MKRRFVVAFAALTAVAVVCPAAYADEPVAPAGVEAKPLMSGEHMARIREEVRLHEQRAHEIEPIIARDRQARHDVEVDWIVLERHAKELHAKANDFRSYAGDVGGRAQADMNNFATELDAFATHDEENAHWQHEIADRLDHAMASESQVRDWHLKMAQRLRDWLATNGN